MILGHADFIETVGLECDDDEEGEQGISVPHVGGQEWSWDVG